MPIQSEGTQPERELGSCGGDMRRWGRRRLDPRGPDCSIFPTFVSCARLLKEIAHMSGREELLRVTIL